MLVISPNVRINAAEFRFSYLRAPGPGGQNVNKVATAVLLRFNILHSPSIPEDVRARIMARYAKRISTQGDLIIKATRYRTQERNKQDAINRLIVLIKEVALPPRKRIKTKPTKMAKERRLAQKKKQASKKNLRQQKGWQNE